MKVIDKFRQLASCRSRFTSLGAVIEYSIAFKRQVGNGVWFRRNSRMGHTSTPGHWVESCPFWEARYRSCFLSNSLLEGMTTGCLEFSPRCFSAEDNLCVCFSNWQRKRSEKDWINLNFTATRLQGALCACLYYYLSGWKCPSVLTCLWKDRRNNAVFNFGFYFKPILLWFFFPWKKRQFDNFWHCLTSVAMLVLILKQAASVLLLLRVYVTGAYHHLAFNSLHHP